MMSTLRHQLPRPPLTDVVAAVLALDPASPLARWARSQPSLGAAIARAEALELAARHGAALPVGVLHELVAGRVGRSPRTIRRWLRSPELSPKGE